MKGKEKEAFAYVVEMNGVSKARREAEKKKENNTLENRYRIIYGKLREYIISPSCPSFSTAFQLLLGGRLRIDLPFWA